MIVTKSRSLKLIQTVDVKLICSTSLTQNTKKSLTMSVKRCVQVLLNAKCFFIHPPNAFFTVEIVNVKLFLNMGVMNLKITIVVSLGKHA